MACCKPKRVYNLSPAGRRSLRRSIRYNKPWLRSTGPRSREGKQRSAANAVFTLDHVRNPAVITDRNEAVILLAHSVLRYQSALLRGDELWVIRLFEAAKWARRLVELGDAESGLGQSLWDGITGWWEGVKQVAPMEHDLFADMVGYKLSE